ncbi:hypothetical protein [Halobellus limi]|uniref:Uncharacterized protein n=1 Tax=Halobellus limi TaxID=699433 RepID=A0A1H6CU33_9EURY|nr:hypothetical protein [Halobellus limi]QCC49130.1 hypothetical protein DV707_15350 [Halobellus limi]SEG76462.1 hypothetical protein SAMN04488133_3738 [Halobellus limi]
MIVISPRAAGVSPLQLPFESLGDLVTIAGSLFLLVMLVALGGFLYQSLSGDGIRWPDEIDEDDEDAEGVTRRPPSDDDEDDWKYY